MNECFKGYSRENREGSEGFTHKKLKALQTLHSGPWSWLWICASRYYTQFLLRGEFGSALQLTSQFLPSVKKKKRQNDPHPFDPTSFLLLVMLCTFYIHLGLNKRQRSPTSAQNPLLGNEYARGAVNSSPGPWSPWLLGGWGLLGLLYSWWLKRGPERKHGLHHQEVPFSIQLSSCKTCSAL